MKEGYIKSLDGVRGLAIIMVMAFHAGILRFGWMGVQLFFVLSGFLITGILWKEKFAPEDLSYKFKRFWIRRSLRIFPLYFGYLLILGLTYLILHFPVYYSVYAPYLFTYTVNYSRLLPIWHGNPLFTHLWSLSIEEQFYLFFPLIVLLLPPRANIFILVLLILVTPLTRYLLCNWYVTKASLPVAADAVYWNTLSHLDAFFMGGLIPMLSWQKKIRRPGLIFTGALVLAFLAGLINYIYTKDAAPFLTDLGYDHDQVGNYAHVWRYSLLDLVFASMILCLTSVRKPLKPLQRIFENRYIVRVGKVSYGMYIFHWMVLVYLFARLFPTSQPLLKVLIFIPYLLTVYLVAELSYRFYESYFIGLKSKWPNKTIKKREENIEVLHDSEKDPTS